ncbi:transketolase family protein [bacterium]|nr:transketolase family protein [bacterium]MCK4436915.1 transketolase family protein [bacterium]
MTEMIATRDAYGKTLVRLGEIDKDVVVLDADLSKSTKTHDFAKKFPERFFQMGISEQDMMGTAAGLATCGKIPFASTFAIFASGRAWEQIRNTICYSNLNVKIVATHAGISVGADGSSHQCIEDISLMRTIANMTVIVPCDAVETGKAVMTAAAMKGPVYIRLGRAKVPIILNEDEDFEIGKGKVLIDGSDATIIACGIMVEKALEAAQKLRVRGGTNCRVINISTIKPIDEQLIIKAARETRAIVTAEEHMSKGGLGSAVAEVIVENEPVPMRMIAIKDRFGESGDPGELFREFGLTEDDIIKAVEEVVKK